MMRDYLRRRGEYVREVAIFVWMVVSALGMCCLLAYGIWRVFHGLGFTSQQTSAVFCAIVLTDWVLRWRKKRREKK
jgi:hypothetical protein